MKQKRILMLLLGFFAFASVALAQRDVTGTVIFDDDESGVMGASVTVQGTKNVAMTDVNGSFTLKNVPSNAQLHVTYVGMNPVTVAAKNGIVIRLTSDARSLDEVVVQVAYGTAKKTTLTGAVSQLDAKQIEVRPVSSVTSALEGVTSGVQVNSTYGQPGDGPGIRIRGFGTVNGSTSPLYVIDGVPFGGNISDLNPADIESITVLKDAASSALYGNRASNGVVLITTKKGSSEKMQFDFRMNQGIYERGIKEYKMVNANQFMEAMWQNLKNQRISNGDDAATAAQYASNNLIEEMLFLNIYNKGDQELFTSDGKLVSDAQILDGYKGDLDWFDQTVQKGYRGEYNLSGSQYSQKADYYFSVGYLKENGYVKTSNFERLSGRAKMNFRPKKWFNAGFTIGATHQKQNYLSDSSSGYANPFMYCRNISPIYPVHLHNADGSYMLDANGNKQYDPGYYTDEDGQTYSTRNQYVDRHYIWESELDKRETFRNTIQSMGYIDIKFLKDFTFSLIGEINLRNHEERTYNNATIGDGKGNSGRTSLTSYRYKNWTFQQQLKWSREFGLHNVNVLLGHENYNYQYDYHYNYKTTEIFALKDNLSNFTNMTDIDGYDTRYRTESYLGRVRWSYDDKYTAEASFRRDGTSRFYKDNRWGNFWSIGASWVISKEDFMKPTASWLNFLKLRADYGQVGNDAGAGYFGYMALYTSNQNAHLGAYYLSQIANYDLKWETGESFGIALESRMFDRWNLSIEYFDRRNKDLLFDVYMPLSAGGTKSSSAESTITQNLGTIKNYGIEINTDVDIVKTQDWGLNLAGNITFLRNKIVKLPEQNKDGIISGIYKIEEGRSRYEYYTYTFMGVDQMTGNSLYKPNDGSDGAYYYTYTNANNEEVTVGDATNGTNITDKITVINGVPYVTNTTYGQKEYHGSAIPKAYGGFTISGRWKDLTVSALFTYQFGSKIYDAVYKGLMSTGSAPSNVHSDIMKSWNGVPEGMTETSADRVLANGIPQINYDLSSDNNATSSRWFCSGNYFIFKNLNVAYRLPRNWVHAIDLDDITLTFTCENLFTKTHRQGMNPQQSWTGYQYNYLVTPRVYTFGINVKF